MTARATHQIPPRYRRAGVAAVLVLIAFASSCQCGSTEVTVRNQTDSVVTFWTTNQPIMDIPPREERTYKEYWSPYDTDFRATDVEGNVLFLRTLAFEDLQVYGDIIVRDDLNNVVIRNESGRTVEVWNSAVRVAILQKGGQISFSVGNPPYSTSFLITDANGYAVLSNPAVSITDQDPSALIVVSATPAP